ncbi:hypothetical protein H4Q26_015713 [Puccinia striiformis f. sp. tritici PST-130]|nr:hypothetical protein H4Q26_015713 [Puccinia striiformis f. sp. tritici PST-130]
MDQEKNGFPITSLREIHTLMMARHENIVHVREIVVGDTLTHQGGGFGLARTYGDPPMGDMTQLVVTLWYRAPELLLGAESYTTAIDLWSIGCIFAELILREPIFPGAGEIDQIGKIFKLLGRPTDEIWPGFKSLPNALSLI